MDSLDAIWSAQGFMPHGHCYHWTPDILWMHVGSDSLVALAYFSIPASLTLVLRKHKQATLSWVLWLFVAFIFFCGLSHLVAVWTTWYPTYRVEGAIKAVTALLSVVTAVILWPALERLLRNQPPPRASSSKALMRDEARRRRTIEAELASLKRNLEQRTWELSRTRQLAQDLYDSTTDAFLAIPYQDAANHTILDCNQSCATLTGLAKAALIGKDLHELIEPAGHEPLDAALTRVRSGLPATTVDQLAIMRTHECPLGVAIEAWVLEDSVAELGPHIRLRIRPRMTQAEPDSTEPSPTLA